MISAFLTILITIALAPAQNTAALKLPFADPGACPFECCQYGEWTASVGQQAYKSSSKESGPAFTIRPGEKVQALTGVVITRKAGIVMVRKETKFDKVTLPAGAKLFVLHSEGEGSYLFWYKGATHSGELYVESIHEGNAHYPWDVLSLPQTEWWARVRNQRGAVGWILNPWEFRGMDACGG